VSAEYERRVKTVTVVEREIEVAERVVEDIEDLETAKGDLDDGHPVAFKHIAQVIGRRIDHHRTVRVKVAAVLLGLSPPTVYKWMDLGLLKEAPQESGVRQVQLTSILRLRPLVAGVQRLGRKRNLLEAVLARIEDEDVLANPSLRRSITQWESGDVVEIAPPSE
jgi:predicted DNA-binding transcriptional regulator AlpA